MMPLTAGRPEQCGLSKVLMFPRRFGSINSHMHYHTHPHTRCAGWSWHDFYHFQCGSRMNDLFHMTSRTRELGQEKIRAGGHKWGARGFCRWPQKPVALGRRAEQLIARRNMIFLHRVVARGSGRLAMIMRTVVDALDNSVQ